jgi:deoxyribonuclease-4
MIKLGAHISISEGFYKAAKVSREMGANTFQFFTRNPRGGAAKEIDEKDMSTAKALLEENNFATLVAHAPYTLNLCSVEARVREFANMIFKADMQRLKKMPPSYYVFHPGSKKELSLSEAEELIANTINEAIDEGVENIILLEGMSGKGSEVGSTFEELKEVIDKIHHKEYIGVCVDTCHMYSAGYDIVNDLEGVFEKFDKIIGIDYLKAAHINDSMNPFNSKKDRHAKLGEGTIGIDNIVKFINYKPIRHLPMILETPNDISGYTQEIKLLKSRYKDEL